MSIHAKASTAIKPGVLEEEEEQSAEIIPWPDLSRVFKKDKQEARQRFHLDHKYFYYRDKKIPLSRFKKAGYDKLLKLLIKEIAG